MRALSQMQEYLVNEFVDDYNDGLMPRRDMMKRVLHIMGSAAGAATILTSLGVRAEDAMAAQSTPATSSEPVLSPLSVAKDDPAVTAQDIEFDSGGVAISAFEARPNPLPDTPLPLVLICHENRGLTPHIRDVARRITREGYVGLAVDLVSRDGGTAAHEEAAVPDLLTRPDPAQHIADFQAALAAAGIEYKINVYPDTEHAFNNDTSPRYNEEQSGVVWADSMAWFADHL